MANEGRLPSGTGGFMRYSDEFKSNFELTPEMVAIICGIVIAVELMLKFFFKP
jgi:preprotein translocase subunit Sec61beta